MKVSNNIVCGDHVNQLKQQRYIVLFCSLYRFVLFVISFCFVRYIVLFCSLYRFVLFVDLFGRTIFPILNIYQNICETLLYIKLCWVGVFQYKSRFKIESLIILGNQVTISKAYYY